MGKIVLVLVMVLLSIGRGNCQYILKVQRQALYDVLQFRELKKQNPFLDSLNAYLRVENASLHQTIDGCVNLNNDRLQEISYLKQINFDSNKEIILLTKEKKRLKRQTFWLKVLIPVAVGATIYLAH